MEKNRSFIQSIFRKVHYKTSLAMVAVFLGMLAFSGYYFFGHNMVNEAEEQQRIARVEMSQSTVEDEDGELSTVAVPAEQADNEEDESDTGNIGGGSDEDTISQHAISPTASATPSLSPTASASATTTPSPKPSATELVLGDPNAQIAILAYYDFECVACAPFVADILPQLKEAYIDTGLVKILFKNFPLTQHKAGLVAHNASMCASEQEQFWLFHDKLFEAQSEWRGKNEQETRESMKNYANGMNMDITAFNSCVDAKKFAGYVESDKAEAKKKGVTEIPTFIIGDEMIVGGHHTFETFKEVIDARLEDTTK